MRIFEQSGGDDYEVLNCVDDDGWETLRLLDGSPRASTWKPLRVRRVRPSRRRKFRRSDCPCFGTHTLTLGRTAVEVFRDMLDAHGELLPLEDEEGMELWLHNTRALDAYDHERTEGSREEDGRIRTATKHVFIPSIVEGVDIFKQAYPRRGTIYVSERFVQRYKHAKLKGMVFKLAWDSDLPPEAQPNIWTGEWK